MAQNNNLNLKLFTSQLNKTTSGIKNHTEITGNLSTNVTDDPKDKPNSYISYY